MPGKTDLAGEDGRKEGAFGLGGGPQGTGFPRRPCVARTCSRGFGCDRLRGSWNKRSARGREATFPRAVTSGCLGRSYGSSSALCLPFCLIPLTFHPPELKVNPSPAWAFPWCRFTPQASPIRAFPVLGSETRRPAGALPAPELRRLLRGLCHAWLELTSLSALPQSLCFPRSHSYFPCLHTFQETRSQAISNPSTLALVTELKHHPCLPSNI